MNDNKLLEEYYEYCKHDGKKMYHLPFIIWLKQVKKIKVDEENQVEPQEREG